jgi:hypothetical protein
MLSNISRNELRSRHRLSHQQIDKLLNESISKDYIKEKLDAFKMVKEFIRIADLLEEHSISFISIKGPLLSQIIYSDPSVRFSHDLDILVDRENVNKIHDVLLSNEYELGGGLAWPTKKSHQNYFAEQVHHIVFRNSTSGVYIELHWTLLSNSPISQKKFQKIIAKNTTTTSLGERKFRVLNHELNLAYLIIHGAKHGWQRLKWLVDIKDYPLDQVNPEQFLLLIKKLNSRKAVSQVGLLLKHYWGIENPLFPIDAISSNSYLMQYTLNKINSPVEKSIDLRMALKDFRYELLIFEGILYKWRVIRLSLFSTADLERISLPNKMLYYIYRPYSFIKRRLIYANK